MISRSPARVSVEMRNVWRAALISPAGGQLVGLARSRSRRARCRSAVPRSAASTRSGRAAKFASPSSATKTAPPISAAPHKPVRIVPENHWTETRRRSTRPDVAPSASNGGSLPRSIGSCGCSQTIWIAPSALIQAPCPLDSRASACARRPTRCFPRASRQGSRLSITVLRCPMRTRRHACLLA